MCVYIYIYIHPALLDRVVAVEQGGQGLGIYNSVYIHNYTIYTYIVILYIYIYIHSII